MPVETRKDVAELRRQDTRSTCPRCSRRLRRRCYSSCLAITSFFQRGPLQSSNTPSVRAWMDPAAVTIANVMADHNSSHQQQNQSHHLHPSVVPIYPSSMGFSSGIGGFSGFHIPARIQGEEEEQDGYSDKPSSASSGSRH